VRRNGVTSLSLSGAALAGGASLVLPTLLLLDAASNVLNYSIYCSGFFCVCAADLQSDQE